MKVLVTCPPMLGVIDNFNSTFEYFGIKVTAPAVVQTLTEEQLINIVPEHDGWIIGDDPATRRVFEAGKAGRLKAAVKWGVGVDNVDFDTCKRLDIPVVNTPNMFGSEVADVAVGYVIGLARHTFEIDRDIRKGGWPKPSGVSLRGKTVALIGFGDVGQHTARRLLAAEMNITVYDPKAVAAAGFDGVVIEDWPSSIGEAEFIVITCALTSSSFHMLNEEILNSVKPGVRIVNVGRGPVIDEQALIKCLKNGTVFSAALDVFEKEPLSTESYLLAHPRCVLGSHNSSNTIDAVERTSKIAIEKLYRMISQIELN